MSSDAFRRVGRGGAGNFYNKKDVQEADRATVADIEAQNPPVTNPLTLTRTQTHTSVSGSGSSSGPNYARAGRGGAGNFTTLPSAAAEPDTGTLNPDDAAKNKELEEAEAETQEERKKAAAAVAASVAARSKAGGLSGRGGAGNWTGGGDGNTEDKKEEQQRAEELELQVLRDVEGGLAVPGRVYRGNGVGSRG